MCLCQRGNHWPICHHGVNICWLSMIIMRILQSLDLCIQKDNFWVCFKSSWQFLTWVPSWVDLHPTFPFQRKIHSQVKQTYNKISVHWGLRMVNIRGDRVLASDAWLQLETNCVEIFSAMISFIEWIAFIYRFNVELGQTGSIGNALSMLWSDDLIEILNFRTTWDFLVFVVFLFCFILFLERRFPFVLLSN